MLLTHSARALAHRSAALAAPLTLAAQRASSNFSTGYSPQRVVTLIPGDGVGHEITQSVVEVFKAANISVKWDVQDQKLDNDEAIEKLLSSIRQHRVALKGVLFTPIGAGRQSVNMQLRKELDLFANVVHCRGLEGVATRHETENEHVDIVVIRENIEGEYSNLEHEPSPGTVESLKVITRENSTRIAEYAFNYALAMGRKKVTAVHKANIMKLSDGLFLEACRDVAAKYSSIEFNEMIVDNTAMQMVDNPYQFDVMVMPNLYGNLVSNIGAGLVGGPGVVSGANKGFEYALFEPGARHVAQNIASKNMANPTAMLLSASRMLHHLNMHRDAERVADAVLATLKAGKYLTADLGGSASTTKFTEGVIENLEW